MKIMIGSQLIREEGCLNPDLSFSGVVVQPDPESTVEGPAVFRLRVAQDVDQSTQCGDQIFDVV